ncbi:MAG: hypothetical protein U0637_00200 [Phycisphaerales bacterium]
MLDRTAATRWTRIAQVGAVGAVALSAAAVVVSLPGQKDEHPPKALEVTIPAPPAGAGGPTQAPPEHADGYSAGVRMLKISNPPAAAKPPDTPPAPVTPVPQAAADITYHGIVTIGPRAMGLIKHNGKQRFVKLQDKVGDEHVEEITPEFVRLGAAHIIHLAERSGDTTARLRAAGAFAQVTAPAPQAPDEKAMLEAVLAAKRARASGLAPAYVADEDIPMWRRMRAQLIISGKYEMQEGLDEIAYKQMQENRDKLKGQPLMTPEEQDAENAYNDKVGRSDGGKEKQ